MLRQCCAKGIARAEIVRDTPLIKAIPPTNIVTHKPTSPSSSQNHAIGSLRSHIFKIDNYEPPIQPTSKQYGEHSASFNTLKFFRSSKISQSDHSPPDDQNQTRKVRFGSMFTYIQDTLTPNILTELPESSKLDPSIILKLSETLINLDHITSHFPDALNIHGKVSYFTILKALQLFLRGFYLRDGCQHKLQVTHTEADPDGTSSTQYGIIEGAPKIIVHWKLVHKPIVSDSDKGSEIREINVPELNEFEEGFSGIFCFELNDDCDLILVHNVENVLILGDRKLSGEGFDGFARV